MVADFKAKYVGTLVGESTSREFRLAVAKDAIREQDIIAVDAVLSRSSANATGEQTETEDIRVWAKVQRIERLNPLFPSEAGHELADTQTDPFDTVLSLSREMVTAVCQVLGYESSDENTEDSRDDQAAKKKGKLNQLRYPPQPASTAYRPDADSIKRIVLGSLDEKAKRALDIAYLSNRPEVNVMVDGHAIVTRHLAILAMTGAGKSWTARRIIEQLSEKNYPTVIFDPHGDYTGLSDVPSLKNKVRRYYANFPLFDEDSDTVAQIVTTLGYELSPTMLTLFGEVFQAAVSFYVKDDAQERNEREQWLKEFLDTNQNLQRFGVQPSMWLVAQIAEAGERAKRDENSEAIQQLQQFGWANLPTYTKSNVNTLEGIKKRAYKAAKALFRMEQNNRRVAKAADPLPDQRTELVKYGQISVVSLAGYTDEFRATLYSIVVNEIYEARVTNDLKLPVLLLLEEAHNFAPARADSAAEQEAIAITKQIAQEGRKFGIGLILISQRPSRLDETTLSQCNSYIIMRLVNPADQNYVRKVIETLGEDEANLLPDLDVGEAILSGQLVNFPVLVKMKEPKSKGEREEEDAFDALEKAYQDSSQS